MAGYETLIAYDSMEGFDKARKEKPDLILLDLILPKMDGYKVCASLKRDKKHSKILVIMLTARTLERHQKQGIEVGADVYITKPLEYEVVTAKIKEMLGEQVI